MARVTVEECRKYIPNRFELSLIAGYRAKDLMAGAEEIMENEKKEKFPVIALREIEDNLLDLDVIRTNIKKDVRNQLIENNISNKDLKELRKVEKSTDKLFDLDAEIENIDDVNEDKDLMFAGDNIETKN